MQTRSIPLLGEKTIDVYAHTHVAVFGLGGVGGYVVEALARSGIGMFTIFDFDKITPSNKNRQIIALDSTVGKWKCEVMKQRILDINPDIKVEYYLDKVDEEFLDKIDFHNFDYVIDCIDDIKGKLAIITKAKITGVHLISSCGTGNKLDSTQFKISDISKTSVCPLAKKIRLELKKRDIHDVEVLYSLEEPHVQADFIPSVSFVPSVAGLLIARHVLLKLRELVLASRVHLVLEGGGMKGVYTDGVLDCFLDYNIEFDAIYGVSAGACAATSLASKQRKRAYHAMVDYLGNPEYASKRSLLKTGNYFNKEFVYYKIPQELIPYDYETANNNPCKLYAVVTNVETGKAEYHMMNDYMKEIDYICASSSLPMLSEIQWIDQKGYLDGGLADPIPIAESKKNALKNVIVLTKPEGYHSSKQSSVLLKAMKLKYHKYPKLIQAIEKRHIKHEQSIKMALKDKNCFIIRPSKDLKIDRLESNKNLLEELYELGYQDALTQIEALKEFMQKK